MTGAIHRGAYLLYLNGYAVPCPSVNVSCGVNSIPEASFVLAPHPMLQRLGADDRIEVAVFYLDDILTPEAPEWRLLFEGEIVGWSYSNTPTGTKMNFSALADIAIFTQLQYAFMTANDVVGQALEPGGTTAKATQAGAFYPFALFKKGLLYAVNSAEQTSPDIDRPFELLYNVVRGMTDSRLSKDATSTPPAIPLVNFFTRWARKRNFINRFAALPVFEDTADKSKGVFPIFESIQNAYALQTMSSNLASTVGDQGSIWSVLQSVFSQVYFEIAMIPTPAAYRVRLADGYVVGLEGITQITANEEVTKPLRLMNYFVKPQMFFGAPPVCNVIFPAMLDSLEYSENYSSQPTRMYVNDGLITGMLNSDQFSVAALTLGYPEAINAVLRERMNAMGGDDTAKRTVLLRQIYNTGKNVLLYPEEFYKGPIIERARAPDWFTLLLTKSPENKKDASALQSTAPEPAKPVNLVGLFDTYVRYEYFRRRYEKRGGHVSMKWNPYIVPGFPCFIFDRRSAGLDVAGYVQSVSWSLSTRGLSTSVSYGYARTLQEFMQTQYEESQRFGVLASGPAEMLPQVRQIVQVPSKAEEFYRGTFFGRSEYIHGNTRKPAVALLHTLVGAKQGVNVTRMGLTGDAGKITTAGIPKRSDGTLDFNISLGSLPETDGIFNDYDAAMQYVARPICSLPEYVKFKSGSTPITLRDKKEMAVPYWSRIYKLRQGPAITTPSAAMTGATVVGGGSSGAAGTATAYTESNVAVPIDFPQTRINWDQVIEAYVAILNQLPPLT